MDREKVDENTRKTQALTETLATQTVFNGIEGKTNGIICLDNDRDVFLAKASKNIARTALDKKIHHGGYTYLGLKGVERDQLSKLLKALPNYDKINSLNASDYFSYGARDYFTTSNKTGIVSYSWIPSADSIGDSGMARNVLIAKIQQGNIEELNELAQTDPIKIYSLLLSGLYPNSLIPLSEEEIVAAIEKEGPNILRLAKAHSWPIAGQYKKGMSNPRDLVGFVQENSVWKRRKPCEEVVVIIE